MKYYSNDLISESVKLHFIITNKYDITYISKAKRVGIMRRHFIWSNKELRYYKDRDFILKVDSDLFFSKIPHIEEIENCHQWISDKLINHQIDRLLKLKAFL